MARISGENQTGEQNADVAATTVPSQAARESPQEGPVDRAGQASVGDTGWLRRNFKKIDKRADGTQAEPQCEHSADKALTFKQNPVYKITTRYHYVYPKQPRDIRRHRASKSIV